ncbi:protein N-terminal glutamine amidohydrolase isoform X1 [Rhopalosiphum maidis]|uniref:protein N-terminal glutamine amidohydrolase isoform X1 n=1 Tax=Rhopalosiphum maidis TaxID=43146 RepID=UPI000EFF3481|nr:protein N-terminal glutamine amidohydrolase isoform X1 [Rhopalosiphum maidis]XP_026812466.1 protein N-terminal glutamine amidohydrolase isoform X1 [Rhopalosiphum maidis]
MSSEQSSSLVIPQKSECMYTACYCEENIWQLAKQILELNKDTPDMKCYVIFISNYTKCVHLWNQNCSHTEGLVFWDYHVFLIVQHLDKTLVFDMDTRLPFPVPFAQYAKEAIREEFKESYSKRYFKVVDGDVYVSQFSSDRNHMIEDGRWMSPPPPYPPILNKEKVNNLDNFISMDPSNEFGPVLNLEEFKARFS